MPSILTPARSCLEMTARPTDPTTPPLIVYSRDEIARVLIARRHEIGWTGEEFDHYAGFSDRYTAKLELGRPPWGRVGFHISADADRWLPALGLRLILCSDQQADAMGAVPMPGKDRAPSTPDA